MPKGEWYFGELYFPECIRIAFVQPSFSAPVKRKQKSKKVNIVFLLISVYLPFPAFVYVNQRKKRMAEHRSFSECDFSEHKLSECYFRTYATF